MNSKWYCVLSNAMGFMTAMLTDASGWWAVAGLLFVVWPETGSKREESNEVPE